MYDVQRIRQGFPYFSAEGAAVYLDNASTTQKPWPVINAVSGVYQGGMANVRRGNYRLSRQTEGLYQRARQIAGEFLGAAVEKEIIFTRSTTESINLVAQCFCKERLVRGGNIVITEVEHHSNWLPWQALCAEKSAELRVVPIMEGGAEAFAAALDADTAMAAVADTSNSLGTILPLREMIKAAHGKGIPVLVDGAQAVSHKEVDVQQMGCDFYCFSGHKLYGPTGIGVLYGKKELLETMAPYQLGGGMVNQVGERPQENIYAPIPDKFEAGTPNIAGAAGLAAAMEYLRSLGLDNIRRHESALYSRLADNLKAIPGAHILGGRQKHGSIISLGLMGASAYDAGVYLDLRGIAVRAGEHCAQPLMKRLGLSGALRVSLGIYNDGKEVDLFCEALESFMRLYGPSRHHISKAKADS
ncbi:MAG: aminotransferase class V-fold PLP-dependent enzyme [Christensenellales bacterium]|jgi:cysteine desulfurase/selenocysteine lyase